MLDFGFVRKQDMDEFRRNYLRRTGTRYDMMFDSKFRRFDTFRALPPVAGCTGHAKSLVTVGSEQACALSG